MKRRTFIARMAASGASLALVESGLAQTDSGTAIPEKEENDVTDAASETGYAPINDLQMYYEIHGSGGVPVVLLHGAYMTTGLDGVPPVRVGHHAAGDRHRLSRATAAPPTSIARSRTSRWRRMSPP